MTRVGVNLLWCVPGEVGGSEEYLARLLAGLGGSPDGLDVTVFALRGYAEAHREVAERFPLVTAPIDGRRRTVRVAFEHTWLPAQVKPGLSADTWQLWRADIQVDKSVRDIRVRAVDGQGRPQTRQTNDPFPSGATGYHTVRIAVS